MVTRAVVPHMATAGYGRIVNVGSIAGKEGNPMAAAYSSSKAAVIALTKAIGKDLDPRTDLFSLGTVLYECLAGEPPFSGEVQSILYRIVHEVPQPPRARRAAAAARSRAAPRAARPRPRA